jgi:hypothetical protein
MKWADDRKKADAASRKADSISGGYAIPDYAIRFAAACSRSGAKRGEQQSKVDAKAVPTLILAALEGGVMMSRLERNDDALWELQGHLKHYPDPEDGVQ